MSSGTSGLFIASSLLEKGARPGSMAAPAEHSRRSSRAYRNSLDDHAIMRSLVQPVCPPGDTSRPPALDEFLQDAFGLACEPVAVKRLLLGEIFGRDQRLGKRVLVHLGGEHD